MSLVGGLRRRAAALVDLAATPALRRALPLAGRDVTARTAGKSCVVLAPHPDDETLGCGATIARKTQAGTRVWIAFASLGKDSHTSRHITPRALGELRRGEAVEAARRLGVPAERVSVLSEEDRIARAAEPLGRAIGRLLLEAQPEELYVVSGLDSHPDHRALNDIVLRMVRAGLIGCSVLEYPIWFWSDGDAASRWLAELAGSLRRRRSGAHAVDRRGPIAPVTVRTAGFLEQKRHALEAHATQMTRLRADEPWEILSDVERGQFLRRFFGERELFFVRQ